MICLAANAGWTIDNCEIRRQLIDVIMLSCMLCVFGLINIFLWLLIQVYLFLFNPASQHKLCFTTSYRQCVLKHKCGRFEEWPTGTCTCTWWYLGLVASATVSGMFLPRVSGRKMPKAPAMMAMLPMNTAGADGWIRVCNSFAAHMCNVHAIIR